MLYCVYFFFNDTATTEIYTLSLHDALPISPRSTGADRCRRSPDNAAILPWPGRRPRAADEISRVRRYSPSLSQKRSEEHTSELQSRQYLVCRLLLEKKKTPSSNIDPSLIFV